MPVVASKSAWPFSMRTTKVPPVPKSTDPVTRASAVPVPALLPIASVLPVPVKRMLPVVVAPRHSVKELLLPSKMTASVPLDIVPLLITVVLLPARSAAPSRPGLSSGPAAPPPPPAIRPSLVTVPDPIEMPVPPLPASTPVVLADCTEPPRPPATKVDGPIVIVPEVRTIASPPAPPAMRDSPPPPP